MTLREKEAYRILHDMKNWVLIIINTLETEGQEEALLCLQSLLEKMTGMERKFSKEGKSAWEQFLNEKLETLKKQEIRIIKKVAPGRYHEMPKLDFITVLGNLLDNAAEALLSENTERTVQNGFDTEICGDSFIEIRMREKCRFVYIYISNSCSETCPERKDQDGLVHGLGLLNVKETVERYHGKLYTRKEGDIFIAEAVMLIPEKK